MSLAQRLSAAGQPHLAAALERLPEEGRRTLAAEAEALDLDLVRRLVDDLLSGDAPPIGGEIAPPDPASLIPLARTDADRARDARARAAGEALLREGAVAAVLLAGGQGTRLGFDGPKGLYPFAPISGRTLFAHHAAKIAALRARYGAGLPWYILTSPQNDAATREAFAAAGWFGLEPDSVRLVVQGTLPAVDRESGQILLDAPDRIALSPDGHGGLLSALRASGALDEMAARGDPHDLHVPGRQPDGAGLQSGAARAPRAGRGGHGLGGRAQGGARGEDGRHRPRGRAHGGGGVQRPARRPGGRARRRGRAGVLGRLDRRPLPRRWPSRGGSPTAACSCRTTGR